MTKKNIAFILVALLFLTALGGLGYYVVSSRTTSNTPFFSTSTRNHTAAKEAEIIELQDGETFDLEAHYVKKQIGNREIRMLAYNGSIPGPFIKVPQNAEITLNFTNNTDIETTLHSHGLRLDNKFDGTPNLTQAPIQPGETFTYKLKFPDAGTFWYHPHVREDYAQELGLSGNYIVTPSDPNYWNPVNQEEYLIIDDISVTDDDADQFYKDKTNYAVMGRFGNMIMINGSTDFTRSYHQGDVVRFSLTNTSNARPYQLSIPGAKIKKVASDLSKYEREEITESIIINPSERYIIEVYFPEAGTYYLTHKSQDMVIGPRTYQIATFEVDDQTTTDSFLSTFNQLKTNQQVVEDIAQYQSYFAKPADKTISLTIDMGGQMMGGEMMMEDQTMNDNGMAKMDGMESMMASDMPIHWEDHMFAINKATTSDDIVWRIIDEESGKENMDIHWQFKVGDVVKVQIKNDPHSMHPMQHPFHIHGQRFLVLSTNGVENPNKVWKDTTAVNVGDTAEILVEMTNPGKWMAHCHIAEHLQSGMMMGFEVF